MSFYQPIAPAGASGDVQLNLNAGFGTVAGFRWITGELQVPGDIKLQGTGSFQTTLQLVTPTANRTVTFPDATGTVGLVAGSSGQAIYNDAGAYAGLATVTTDGTNVTLTGRFISSLNGAASAPPATLTGTWFTGGTATTTKPQLLLEPAGTTSTAWSTAGTGLGINATSGFTGRLLDAQVNGTSRVVVTGGGNLGIGTVSPASLLTVVRNGTVVSAGLDSSTALTVQSTGSAGSSTHLNILAGSTGSTGQSVLTFGDSDNPSIGRILYRHANDSLAVETNAAERIRVTSAGNVGIGTDVPTTLLDVNSNAVRLRTARTPASAAATGAQGEISWDADYIYVCTATDTWKRAALSTW